MIQIRQVVIKKKEVHRNQVCQRPRSVKHEGLETEDLQKGGERERRRERHTHKTATKTGHTGKKQRRGGGRC